jgi:hypothetical protein
MDNVAAVAADWKKYRKYIKRTKIEWPGEDSERRVRLLMPVQTPRQLII